MTPQPSMFITPAAPLSPVLRDSLSGKRIAIFGFAPEDGMSIRETLESCDALCRIIREESASSMQTAAFDMAVVHLSGAGLPAVVEGMRLLIIGDDSALWREIGVLGSPDRQFMLLPGSAPELLLRASALAAAPVKAATPRPSSATVVLADDDPSITAMLKTTLSRHDITCHVAQDGETALALTRKLLPQALVLDVNMPHSDGFEVLSSIRNDPAMRNVRVLMLTGCEQETDILRGFGLGTDDYVTKPFNPLEVAARIKRLVGLSA